LDGYFGLMTDNAVFIGTDASERWSRNEFYQYSKPHFDKGKAWDFEPYDRQVFVSADGSMVWFSELLNTWMGVCRGSGILSGNENIGYKIEQYHLSVTVPNEQIRAFINLVEQDSTYKEPESN
jgi:hypothetical protein